MARAGLAALQQLAHRGRAMSIGGRRGVAIGAAVFEIGQAALVFFETTEPAVDLVAQGRGELDTDVPGGHHGLHREGCVGHIGSVEPRASAPEEPLRITVSGNDLPTLVWLLDAADNRLAEGDWIDGSTHLWLDPEAPQVPGSLTIVAIRPGLGLQRKLGSVAVSLDLKRPVAKLDFTEGAYGSEDS